MAPVDLTQLGLTYTGAVGLLAGEAGFLAGDLVLEATSIAASGDEVAAQAFWDQVTEKTPAEDLLRRIGREPTAAVVTQHSLLVPARLVEHAAKEKRILKGALSFADLTLELEVQLRAKDSEGCVILLEGAGVLSRGAARALLAELCGAEAVKANVFVNQLSRLFLDPALNDFSDLSRRLPQSEDILLQRFAEERGWVITDQFGRLTFLAAKESLKLRLGHTEGILHPSIKISFQDSLPEVVVAIASEVPVFATESQTLSVADAIIEGALMRVGSAPAKSKHETIPYTLLRRTIYALLSEARFEAAAQMVENISDPLVLIRFFEDLVQAKTDGQNSFKNPQKFLRNTTTYAGMMFAEMIPAKVAQIILLLYRQSRLHDQQALDQWLLIAFRAIRPRERLADFGPETKLPHLSIILGTLMEWEETRILAERLLRQGLEPDHPAYSAVYEAMYRLHLRYEAFAHPFTVQTDIRSRIFDGAIAARELGVVQEAGFLARIADHLGRRSPMAPYFDPPATVLARREEIYSRLKDALEKIDEMENLNPLLASLVCFSLPPSDVYRLAQEVSVGRDFSPSQILAHLLSSQPADVVMAFFRAWGDSSVAAAAKTLAAIWNLNGPQPSGGRRGHLLVAEVVDLALKEDEAAIVMQKMLAAEHGGDTDLMEAQMDIYLELAADPRFEGAINSYEIFVTTGVLLPKDLGGKFREEAIMKAIRRLESGDEAEANQAFHVLDQLGPRAQKVLGRHIQAYAKKTKKFVDERVPSWAIAMSERDRKNAGDYVILSKEVAISLKDVVEKFPLTSRAMRAYVSEQIWRTDGSYIKEFKKHGHIDHIASGEVEIPAIIQELAGLGDAALVLLEPFARGGEILVERRKRYSSAAAGVAGEETWQEFHPIFIPFIHLAELIGTSAAHQILADLYEVISKHTETEIRSGYFSAEYPIPQTPLRLIIRALARMEHRAGYKGPVAVEAHADFMSRYPYLVESSLAFGALVSFAEENVERTKDVGKKTAEVWERYDVPISSLMAFRKYVHLWNAILENLTSPFLYWELLKVAESPITIPIPDVVRKIALDEDPNNRQRPIAIKTLFWCFRGIRMNLALQPILAPDPALRQLYNSGLAARHADLEDLDFFLRTTGV